MKKSSISVTARTNEDIARILNLNPRDAVEIELRSNLNAKIIEVTKKQKLTHAKVAILAGTSRTKITALLNANTRQISTSLMIRILAALGVRVKISYAPIKMAA
jgi:predicted XRE-type DNA-binding protein